MATTATTDAIWISARQAGLILGVHREKAMELVRAGTWTTKIVPGRKYPRVLKRDVDRMARASIVKPIPPSPGA